MYIERICRFTYTWKSTNQKNLPKLTILVFFATFQNWHFFFQFFFCHFFKIATFCFANFSGQNTLCTLFCKSKINFCALFFVNQNFSTQFLSCNQTFENLTGNHTERICRITYIWKWTNQNNLPKIAILAFFAVFSELPFFVCANFFAHFVLFFLPFFRIAAFCFCQLFKPKQIVHAFL